MSDLAIITRVSRCGMITLRGDLSSAKIKAIVKAATGQAMPQNGKIAGDGTRGALWMSPDEVLLLVDYAEVADTLGRIYSDLDGTHFLAVDVSDARAVFRVEGADAREVLARLCPVDLHADSFAVGDFRRTRMAQVPAAFWRHETGFDVICFRSVADYVEGILRRSAAGAVTGALG